MDPQSLAFTPQSDLWRLNSTVRTIQDVQQEHAERLLRLERRNEDDARMKSVWGTSSPFPGVLSGTPQHGPVTNPSDFSNFDDDAQSNHMVRSLQLDADDEPRRVGATSRTNSVRFDESANQGQWAHGARMSAEFLTRSSSLGGLSGLGGYSMFERSNSHKSDGRHSSTGHSVVSARANSLGLDTSHPLSHSPNEPPGLAPGLFILGSVPAIVRCWLNQDFKHESLLYAVVCTGSYKSYLDVRMIHALGFGDQIRHDINGSRKIKLPIYFPEAVPHPASSRSNSPAPQVPSLTVDFAVLDQEDDTSVGKPIQIFIGSDTLRAHNADVLFSSNLLTLFDDDRSKLSIPLVRPEDEESFKGLSIINKPWSTRRSSYKSFQPLSVPVKDVVTNGLSSASLGVADTSDRGSSPVEIPLSKTEQQAEEETTMLDFIKKEPEKPSQQKPPLSPLDMSKNDKRDVSDQSPISNSASRSTTSPAIWSNWRRDASGTNPQNDWANASRNSGAPYSRPNRDQGIKVLKPIRQSSRSAANTSTTSPSNGQSRFFDEGRRRLPDTGSDTGDPTQFKSATDSKSSTKENSQPVGSKPRVANPVGGASAFGWLNSGSQK